MHFLIYGLLLHVKILHVHLLKKFEAKLVEKYMMSKKLFKWQMSNFTNHPEILLWQLESSFVISNFLQGVLSLAKSYKDTEISE